MPIVERIQSINPVHRQLIGIKRGFGGLRLTLKLRRTHECD